MFLKIYFILKPYFYFVIRVILFNSGITSIWEVFNAFLTYKENRKSTRLLQQLEALHYKGLITEEAIYKFIVSF